MISFKNFINEAENRKLTAKQAAEIVYTNCKPVLNDLDIKFDNYGRMSPCIFRGIRGVPQDSPWILSGEQRIRAMDSPIELTQTLDSYFQKVFGQPFRIKSVFASGSKSYASNYGDVFMIFPVGNYKCVWSPIIADAYAAFDNTLSGSLPLFYERICQDLGVNIPFGEDEDVTEAEWEKWYAMVYDWLNLTHPYESGHIVEAISQSSHIEIMIKCKEYVAIPYDIYLTKEFVEELKALYEQH